MDASDVLKVGMFLLPVLMLAFVVQYALLRVRNLYAERPDRQLGRKAVCHLFLSLAIVLGLAGLTLSAADLFDRLFEPIRQARAAAQPGATPAAPAGPTEWFNDAQRTAAALILSGLFHGTLFGLVLRLFTNDRDQPAVRRTFIGTRLVFAGVIWIVSATVALVLVLKKGDTDLQTLQTTAALGIVWGVAAGVHLWLLLHDPKRAGADGE